MDRLENKQIATVRTITGELIGGFILYGIVFGILYSFIYSAITNRVSEAIKLRIIELLDTNNLSAYKLSYKGGISPSNISDVLRGKVSEPTISTILHICEGANITLKDFFDSKLFDEVEAVERDKRDLKK